MNKDYDEVNPGDKAEIYMEQDGSIGHVSDEGYRKRSFTIIAVILDSKTTRYCVCYENEHLYNSAYLRAKASLASLEENARGNSFYHFKVIKNYLSYDGKFARWLDRTKICNIVKSGPDGCPCKVCKEFYDMAVPNQPDGQTLICWSCRQNPMRAYY